MNSVSKVKIAVGYTLLLAVMFFSLFFVNREMENLMLSDDRDIQDRQSVDPPAGKRYQYHPYAAYAERGE